MRTVLVTGASEFVGRNLVIGSCEIDRTDSVPGADIKLAVILPGYIHEITDIGKNDVSTLFWASESIGPQRPETYVSGVFL